MIEIEIFTHRSNKRCHRATEPRGSKFDVEEEAESEQGCVREEAERLE
jgi:hypothetical protein